MSFLERVTIGLESWFVRIAGLTLLAMMLITVTNMALRKLGMPFGAVAEVVGWLAALTVAFSLSYSQFRRAHIVIELLVDRLPARLQAVVRSVTGVLALGMFSIAAYELFAYGVQLMESGQVAESLRIPFYPIVFAVGVGVTLFCVRLLVELLGDLRGVVGE